MNLYISSDHGGFALKKQLIDYLNNQNLYKSIISDLGPYSLNINDDYPLFAYTLAQKVSEEIDSLGILICRSGNGMVITANKIKGAYAALCFTPHHSEMARKDDSANILCLDADYTDIETQKIIVTRFLTTDFAGDDTRYGRRLRLTKDIEEKNFK